MCLNGFGIVVSWNLHQIECKCENSHVVNDIKSILLIHTLFNPSDKSRKPKRTSSYLCCIPSNSPNLIVSFLTLIMKLLNQ